MKFRKKPVVIEATQWFKHGDHPKVYDSPFLNEDEGFIMTVEGLIKVSAGDWIVTNEKGGRYTFKPDFFEMNFERVEEAA